MYAAYQNCSEATVSAEAVVTMLRFVDASACINEWNQELFVVHCFALLCSGKLPSESLVLCFLVCVVAVDLVSGEAVPVVRYTETGHKFAHSHLNIKSRLNKIHLCIKFTSHLLLFTSQYYSHLITFTSLLPQLFFAV